MSNRTGKQSFWSKAYYVFCCLVWAILFLLAVGVLVRTLQVEFKPGRPQLHIFLVVGFAAFFLSYVFPRIRHNVRWLMNFTHEFIHLIFALLFFRKIRRFNVDDSDSHVSFSGGRLGYSVITLAPYCVPIYTLALLPWRHRLPDRPHFRIPYLLLDPADPPCIRRTSRGPES